MASRKEQKELARAERLAKEQELAAQVGRTRRFQIFGGVTVAAVIVVVVLIAVSSGGGGGAVAPSTPAAKAAAKQVNSLLAGIPESGTTLGKSSAPITITEYGDLECSVCDEFATPASFTNPENEPGTGWEDALINQYVRTGKAKLVYRSLETASGQNPDQSAFQRQQTAANAAGLQGKAWYFIELMYNEQGQEGTGYVTDNYLEGLAKQIPGLNFQKWMAARNLPGPKHQVSADSKLAASIDGGLDSTPTVLISGPGGKPNPIVGLPQSGYSAYVSAINAAS
jgi:protein-disulfide isomerase